MCNIRHSQTHNGTFSFLSKFKCVFYTLFLSEASNQSYEFLILKLFQKPKYCMYDDVTKPTRSKWIWQYLTIRMLIGGETVVAGRKNSSLWGVLMLAWLYVHLKIFGSGAWENICKCGKYCQVWEDIVQCEKILVSLGNFINNVPVSFSLCKLS